MAGEAEEAVPTLFYSGRKMRDVNWSKDIFVRNARIYELVLEGMWEEGEREAIAIASLLQEMGMDRCSVLDVPCGIGRVGIPLAELGFPVSGIDISPRLVEAARRRAKQRRVDAEFSVGDMLDLSRVADSSFDCAINVFTSIGYGTEADDLRFFRGLRRVVRKGGLFVVSGLRNRDYIVRHPAQNIYEETEKLLVLGRYQFDLRRSREKGSWRFYLRAGDSFSSSGEFPIDIRIYSPHEVVRMLEEARWSVSGVYESISTKRPFSADSPVYSLVAEPL